jgi:hypothetical protein
MAREMACKMRAAGLAERIGPVIEITIKSVITITEQACTYSR